jgi:hypothetical protein
VRFRDGVAVREVCELCAPRAADRGWQRDGGQSALAPLQEDAAEASLGGRFWALLDQARRGFAAPATAIEVPQGDAGGDQRAVAAAADLALREADALALFNASEHAANVASVGRSLGVPYVRVDAAPASGAVELLVVWQLCWYRYAVALKESVVSVIGQGYELEELGGELAPANAFADAEGQIALAGR